MSTVAGEPGVLKVALPIQHILLVPGVRNVIQSTPLS